MFKFNSICNQFFSFFSVLVNLTIFLTVLAFLFQCKPKISDKPKNEENSVKEENEGNGDNKDSVKIIKIIFDAKGGSKVPLQEVMEGKMIVDPKEPSKSGFVFGGWYSDDSLSKKFKFDAIIKDDDSITLYAKWVAKVDTSLKISFEKNGGSETPSQSLKQGDRAVEPKNPTKASFDFVGWYSDNSLQNLFDFSSKITTDTTLYAKWATAGKSFKVTFDSRGGNTPTEQTIVTGEKVIEPAVSRNGFTFDGWYKDKALITKFDFNNFITKNLTLYAKWNAINANTYRTVTFEAANGSGIPSPQSIIDGGTSIEPKDPYRAGFLLEGWYTDNNTFNNRFDFTTKITADTTIYGKWVAKTGNFYLLIFDSKGANSIASQEIKQGQRGTEPAVPKKADHIFVGWYTDDGTFKNSFDFNTIITKNTTLYAKYSDGISIKNVVFDFEHDEWTADNKAFPFISFTDDDMKADSVYEIYTSTESGIELEPDTSMHAFQKHTATGKNYVRLSKLMLFVLSGGKFYNPNNKFYFRVVRKKGNQVVAASKEDWVHMYGAETSNPVANSATYKSISFPIKDRENKPIFAFVEAQSKLNFVAHNVAMLQEVTLGEVTKTRLFWALTLVRNPIAYRDMNANYNTNGAGALITGGEEASLLMVNRDPTSLQFRTVIFQRHSAENDLTFQKGKVYYFISQGNSLESGIIHSTEKEKDDAGQVVKDKKGNDVYRAFTVYEFQDNFGKRKVKDETNGGFTNAYIKNTNSYRIKVLVLPDNGGI